VHLKPVALLTRELMVFGVPLGLLVGGLVGILWPTGRWLAFTIVFGVWTALMIAGIIWAIQRRKLTEDLTGR
jgi:hypothetical protein